MPYEFKWLHEDKIAFVMMSGEFNKEQIEGYVKEMMAFLDQSTADKVHFLEDMTMLDKVGMSAIHAAKYGRDILAHERMGWLVAYGLKSKSANVIVTMLTQLFRYNFRSVGTFNEAVSILKRQDLSLSHVELHLPVAPNAEV